MSTLLPVHESAHVVDPNAGGADVAPQPIVSPKIPDDQRKQLRHAIDQRCPADSAKR